MEDKGGEGRGVMAGRRGKEEGKREGKGRGRRVSSQTTFNIGPIILLALRLLNY
jgi:hypothetical protein